MYTKDLPSLKHDVRLKFGGESSSSYQDTKVSCQKSNLFYKISNYTVKITRLMIFFKPKSILILTIFGGKHIERQTKSWPLKCEYKGSHFF